MIFTQKEWKSGTVTKPAHVVIDGVEYELVPAKVEGGTPITIDELNRIEQGVADALNLVVNSKTVTDKTEQTYSANIIDELIGLTKLNNADNELYTINEGFTVVDGNVYKDRNRYFGDLTIKSTNAYSSTASIVATFNKTLRGMYNKGCFLSVYQWGIDKVGRAFYSSSDKDIRIYDDQNLKTCYFAKISFDIVTY